MKKIPIKFRGRFWLKGLDPSDINTRLSDGDFVFGGYARMKFLFDDDEGDYIIQNDSTAFLVYPDSVSQLVGYDVDDNEVYEGDELLDANNIDIKNTAHCHVITKLYVNANLKCFRLKKANNNEKTGKLLTRYFAPQPLPNFQSSDGLNQMFKQLCKIYGAENIAFNPDSYFNGKADDKLPLIKALGELIIIATSYLEKIGVNDSARQRLFRKLNEENARYE